MATKVKDKPKVSKIVTWKPKKDQILTDCDGGIFLVYFEKVFDNKDIAIYDRFLIKKSSYEKFLPTITKYINFFENFYDTDHELIMAYLKLKYVLDEKKMFDKNNVSALIDMIYEVMLTPAIVDKVKRMVNDNYLDDIESKDKDDSKRYKTGSGKKHLESLEFTNEHVKILLSISFGMKIICPVLFHFASLRVIKIDKDSDFIYQFYKRLFPLFSGSVNMYNKLFTYVKAKVMEAYARNQTIFNQRDILGTDIYTVVHQFLQKVLISENMMKYKFSECWNPKTNKFKENPIGFQKTIVKFQVGYFVKEQYPKTLTEVVSEKNVDGLSGIDKLSMNQQKIDEGICIMSDVNIELIMKDIKRMYDFCISDAEIDYYLKHFQPSKLQSELIFSYWARYFGSYRNVNLVSRRDFMILSLILKRRLLLVSGYDAFTDIDEYVCEGAILPYILTGNLGDSKVSTRIIRNNKFITKVKESSLYKNLVENKYKNLSLLKPDYILGLLSRFINTQFNYVSYENPDLLGKPIICNEDKISDEILLFIGSI